MCVDVADHNYGGDNHNSGQCGWYFFCYFWQEMRDCHSNKYQADHGKVIFHEANVPVGLVLVKLKIKK